MNDYVGPYARAVYSIKMTKVPIKGCPKCKGAGGYSETKFCGNCGGPMGKYMTDGVEESVDPWEVTKEMKEALTANLNLTDTSDPCHIYVPNFRRDDPRTFTIDDMPEN